MKMEKKNDILLEVNSIKKYFPVQAGFFRKTVGYIKAVDDVSFYIKSGETLGIVGESGCGKTTLGRCIIRAIEPSGGEIKFRTENGKFINLMELDGKNLRPIRKDMQMIFQDPYSSLNPRMIVLDIIAEPLVCHNIAKGGAKKEIVIDLMKKTGLDSRYLERYPHAFSGGQRQRIGIARALATNPKLIVCDEPVSALDVSVQAQILNLLKELQSSLNLTYLFISHDLGVIRYVSHRVGVMYAGKLVELANCDNLFYAPKHPYTEALLSAKPNPNPRIKAQKIILKGEVVNLANLPSGCYLSPRCKYSQDVCRALSPELREIKPEHFVACHFAHELKLQGMPELTSQEVFSK